MAKKTAKESLGRLRTGIARETPASRAAVEDYAESVVDRTHEKESGGAGSGERGHAPERKVRVSVDLPRSEHKYLRDFAYDAEADAMGVMRALLREMTEDDDLAARIRERLAGSP